MSRVPVSQLALELIGTHGGLPLKETSTDWRVDPDGAFQEFHTSNPHVYEVLVRLARDAKAKGKRCAGIKMLWEIMRWAFWLAVDDDDSGYRLNNNYPSRYARLIMDREPDLAGFFNLRELKR